MTTEDLLLLAEQIADKTIIATKEVLNMDEAARYIGLSRSYLYKLTYLKQIPHYKYPSGKYCFFNRKELEKWLQTERVQTVSEIEQQALAYNLRKKKAK